MSGIKVFLVEDEMIIRNGVKRSIDWEKEGYEFVGEASDGELAYPLILKEKPDIMITDIRMPFMDGMELSRLVKAELPNIKILILSGYDEFQYAKEAIKIGVTDYLLKPISSAKLLEALEKLGMQRQVTLSVKSFLILPEILHASDMVAILPSRLVAGMDDLMVFDPPIEVPGFTKVAAWHERTHRDVAHRWLRELLFTQCA